MSEFFLFFFNLIDWGTGDPKESFYIGPLEGTLSSMNQWPSLGVFLIFTKYFSKIFFS